MDLQNFTLEDGVHVVVDGNACDLHNDYDFTGYTYDLRLRQLSCHWDRCGDEPGQVSKYGQVVIVFEDVHAHWVRPRDPELPFTEDTCVAGFGLAQDEDKPEDMAFYFQFQSAQEIWVIADRAHVETAG